MKTKDYISTSLGKLASIIRLEIYSIFRDEGVLLIMLLAPIIYATIYSSVYGSEVLRDVPVGVIDMSKTSSSRKLVTMLDMGPNTHVAYEPGDMSEAKELLFSRKIHGIIYIPANYAHNIAESKSSAISIYLDASYMLFYRQVFQEIAAIVSKLNYDIAVNRLMSLGENSTPPQSIASPIVYQSHALFNPYLGYGTFVMPPVLMLILQQTLLIGICMIGGTWRERESSARGVLQREAWGNPLLVITGKAITYASLYSIIIFYLLHIHYRIFHYPMIGSASLLAIFIGLYILTVIFLGIALSALFQRRETPLMVMLWTSIPLLMLSGISFPHEAMPTWLRYLANIFPSTFATQGFVKIATEGASIREVMPELKPLILLCVIYFFLAYCALRHKATKQNFTSTNSQPQP